MRSESNIVNDVFERLWETSTSLRVLGTGIETYCLALAIDILFD
jgi:hypothetical protein